MATNDLKNLLSELLWGGLSHQDILTQLTDTGVISGPAPTSGNASGSQTSQGAAGDVTAQVASLNTQLTALSTAQNASITAMSANTSALVQSTTSKTGGGSVTSTLESAASSVFGGGILGSPILAGILSLFGGGGGGSSQTASLVPFALPPAISYEGALTAGGQVAPADTGQNGQPRSLAQTNNTSVTVQVNALDSQSFLDHSDDIAQAVRNAILNSSSLNDVLANL